MKGPVVHHRCLSVSSAASSIISVGHASEPESCTRTFEDRCDTYRPTSSSALKKGRAEDLPLRDSREANQFCNHR